uniref:Uncharacterized protein n=1 Tax=Arundo donax TaxID=35708 RepID=A0A0A9Q259_ARUDO
MAPPESTQPLDRCTLATVDPLAPQIHACPECPTPPIKSSIAALLHLAPYQAVSQCPCSNLHCDIPHHL